MDKGVILNNSSKKIEVDDYAQGPILERWYRKEKSKEKSVKDDSSVLRLGKGNNFKD